MYTGKFHVIAMTIVKCEEQTLKLNVKTGLHFSNKNKRLCDCRHFCVCNVSRKRSKKVRRYSHIGKSHTGFSLVQKLVTLNDPKRRNGRHSALLHRLR